MINKFRKRLEEYVSISDNHWNKIKGGCKIIQVKNKEVLVKYNELSRDGFFLASGSFEMSLLSENGDAKTVWFFIDELFNIFGTFDSIFSEKPTQYEITALEDSTVIKFSRDTAQTWKESFPNIRELMDRDIRHDFVVTQEIKSYLTSNSPTDFIAYLNKKYPVIIQRIPDKNIAQFMGITPEWYSKLQKRIAT